MGIRFGTARWSRRVRSLAAAIGLTIPLAGVFSAPPAHAQPIRIDLSVLCAAVGLDSATLAKSCIIVLNIPWPAVLNDLHG